jgi:hypothetical protein
MIKAPEPSCCSRRGPNLACGQGVVVAGFAMLLSTYMGTDSFFVILLLGSNL